VSNPKHLMRFSPLDRLVFLGSFLMFMNWGVRLTQSIFNNLF